MASPTVITRQVGRNFFSVCSCVPPRHVRVALNILGLSICVAGMTIGIMALTSPSVFWLQRTVSLLGPGGCIALVMTSYLAGNLLTECGSDPIHSSAIAAEKNIPCCQNLLEVVTRIPRVVFSTLLDLVLLLPYGAFMVYHRLKPTVNTVEELGDKDSRPAIALIHGTNSNNGVWVFGRPFLNCPNYGRVIPINLEENGAFFSDSTTSIDTFAQRVFRELEKHWKQTNHQCSNFILIGHSMGGMVASRVAQMAVRNEIEVRHVFTIASPLRGAPLLDALPNCVKGQRFIEMGEGSSYVQETTPQPDVSYYNYGSAADMLVPTPYTDMPTQPNIKHTRYPFFGHLALVALPPVWLSIRRELDHIYARGLTA